jgi:hypothetical protein
MKYDFKAIKAESLDGKQVKDIHKTIANALYTMTKNLDLVEKAIEINKGKPVELEKAEIAEVKRILNDEKIGFYAFVKKAILDYIEKVNTTKV